MRKFVNASTLDFLSTFYTYEELRFGSMAGCVFFLYLRQCTPLNLRSSQFTLRRVRCELVFFLWFWLDGVFFENFGLFLTFAFFSDFSLIDSILFAQGEYL